MHSWDNTTIEICADINLLIITANIQPNNIIFYPIKFYSETLELAFMQ